MNPPPIDKRTTEDLAEHLEWLRRLARSLVRDPEVADDLTHETLLAALRSSGERPRSPRSWLRSVLVRQHIERLRRRGRREDRHRQVARPDFVDSPLVELERNSINEVVTEEVANLPETYQEVLRWRYFDERTPTQIAAEHDIPIATVKTRLQRGLAQLRERLDARHGGDGRTWVAALAPLWLPARKASSVAILAAVGAVAAALIVIVVGMTGARHQPPADLVVARPDDGLSAGAADLVEAQPVETGAGTNRAPATGPSSTAANSPLPLRRTSELVTGRVLDQAGQPVRGVPVVFETWDAWADSNPIGLTDAQGNFSLRGASGRGILRALGGRATLAAARVEGDRRTGLTVVVAPASTFSGTVLDDAGRPIAGARIEWHLPPSPIPARTLPLPNLVRANAEGAFSISGAAISGARLVVSASGFTTEERELPVAGSGALQVLLNVSDPLRMVTGRVVDETGAPVADAHVGLVHEEAHSGKDGAFRLGLPEGDGPWTARALVIGRQPGTVQGQRVDGRLQWDGEAGELELVLGGAPRSLTGRVVDASGRALSGVRVWLDDPTPLRLPRVGGGLGGERSNQLPGEQHPDELIPFVEQFLATGEPGYGWRPQRTAKDGSFTFEGLLDRAYTIGALHPVTLQRATAREGEGELVITFFEEPTYPRVAGRIVDGAGRPLAGAQVMISVTALETRAPEGHDLRTTTSADSQFTGDEGSFAFDSVPEAHTWLRVQGPDLMPFMAPLAEWVARDGVDLSDLEVEVTALGRFQLVDGGDIERVDAVDGEGEVLALHQVEGGRRDVIASIELEDGRTPVLQVPTTVVSLRLYRGEEVVATIPLTALGGGVIVIRP